MKKVKIYILATFLSMLLIPSHTFAGTGSAAVTVNADKTDKSAEASVLISRLMSINSMDKSTLSSSDKKDLRKEVLTIKASLKKMDGGIYLSGGALIIIIILLIILL